MTKKKKRKGDITHNINVDIETGEIDEFFWDEDHEPPPIVKPKIKKNSGKKDYSRKN